MTQTQGRVTALGSVGGSATGGWESLSASGSAAFTRLPAPPPQGGALQGLHLEASQGPSLAGPEHREVLLQLRCSASVCGVLGSFSVPPFLGELSP